MTNSTATTNTPTTTETTTMNLTSMMALAATMNDQMVAAYNDGDKLEFELLNEELTHLETSIEIAIANELDDELGDEASAEEAAATPTFEDDHGMCQACYFGVDDVACECCQATEQAKAVSFDQLLTSRNNLETDMSSMEVDSYMYVRCEAQLDEMDRVIEIEIGQLQEREAEEAKMDRDVQEYQNSLINVPF
jgi:hypothetical protein